MRGGGTGARGGADEAAATARRGDAAASGVERSRSVLLGNRVAADGDVMWVGWVLAEPGFVAAAAAVAGQSSPFDCLRWMKGARRSAMLVSLMAAVHVDVPEMRS